MSDYRLIIKVKNNLIYGLMKDRGIETQNALARATGLHPSTVGEVANLKVGAFARNGQPLRATQVLCDFFGCLPEEIFPPEVLYSGIQSNVVERYVSSNEVAEHLGVDDITVESKQIEANPYVIFETNGLDIVLDQALNLITERQKRILTALYIEEKTLREVGREFEVTGDRIRNIRDDAFRKLREIISEGSEYDGDTTMSGMITRLASAIDTRACPATY